MNLQSSQTAGKLLKEIKLPTVLTLHEVQLVDSVFASRIQSVVMIPYFKYLVDGIDPLAWR
jgi:hypothetical protein